MLCKGQTTTVVWWRFISLSATITKSWKIKLFLNPVGNTARMLFCLVKKSLLDLRLQSKTTISQNFVTRISEYSIAAVCHFAFALWKRSRSRFGDVINQLNLHQSVFCVQNLDVVFKFLSDACRLSFVLAFSSFFFAWGACSQAMVV